MLVEKCMYRVLFTFPDLINARLNTKLRVLTSFLASSNHKLSNLVTIGVELCTDTVSYENMDLMHGRGGM